MEPDFYGLLVAACPDPHIERWFLADPPSFHEVVGHWPVVGWGKWRAGLLQTTPRRGDSPWRSPRAARRDRFRRRSRGEYGSVPSRKERSFTQDIHRRLADSSSETLPMSRGHRKVCVQDCGNDEDRSPPHCGVDSVTYCLQFLSHAQSRVKTAAPGDGVHLSVTPLRRSTTRAFADGDIRGGSAHLPWSASSSSMSLRFRGQNRLTVALKPTLQ